MFRAFVPLVCLTLITSTPLAAQQGAVVESSAPVYDAPGYELTSYERAALGGTECDGGNSCDSFCGQESCCDKLLGIFAHSDHCLGEFISPMTNPIFFEDPRTLTEARVIFANHTLPGALGGGDAQLVACQLRAALTENLSLIATKDGFLFAGPDVPLEDGWADINLGLKYNLYKDYDAQQVLSAGARYELPIGSQQALQGNGDGEFDLFLSGATALGQASHFMSAAGFRLPADTNAENQIFYWSGHLDRRLGSTNLYLLGEMNWYHYLKSGAGGIPGVGGLDLFNLGSTNMAGVDIVTGAFGLKYKPNYNREFGIAWEAPVTDNRDVMNSRLTLDAIFRY
jgi:hypothetical protein